MPATLKQGLDTIRRVPHVHLIVDATEAQRGMREEVIGRVHRFAATHGLDARNTTLHITDGYGSSMPYSDDALEAFSHHAGHGGFFTDRPIRRVVADALTEPGPAAPFIVVVPSWPPYDARARGIWLEGLADLAALMPEGDRFFMLYDTGMLEERRFSDPERSVNEEPVVLEHPHVRAWPGSREALAYLSDACPARACPVDFTREPQFTACALLEACIGARGTSARIGPARAAQRRELAGCGARQLPSAGAHAADRMDVPRMKRKRNAGARQQEEVLKSKQSLDTVDRGDGNPA